MNKEGSRVICNPVPTSFQAHRVTYDSRPFLVHLVFASLHPSSFHEMIFTLVYYLACESFIYLDVLDFAFSMFYIPLLQCSHAFSLAPCCDYIHDAMGVQHRTAKSLHTFFLFIKYMNNVVSLSIPDLPEGPRPHHKEVGEIVVQA